MAMYEKILVPLDGSEPSNHALEHALSIAEKYKSKVTLLAVVPRVVLPVFPDEGFGTAPVTAAKDMARYQDKMKEIYENVLKDAREEVSKEHPGIELETVLKEGRPSATIVETAEEGEIDLIVMGSRGVGGITGWILGSTSRRVVDSCTKPILIVK
ncbi:MAG: universal stress protein [Candidatus Bathyarchaeota archaeon]|nr:MAG: universal stress protein [Candidatus Bathyarchaeota archaeon]